MTPARQRALQWFFERGEVRSIHNSPVTSGMLSRMVSDNQVQRVAYTLIYTLTDEGRRDLHGDKT